MDLPKQLIGIGGRGCRSGRRRRSSSSRRPLGAAARAACCAVAAVLLLCCCCCCFRGALALSEGAPPPALKARTVELTLADGNEDVWRGELAHLSWKPRAFVYRNFLTDAECEHLKQKAAGQLRKSSVVDNETGEERDSDVRTSSGTFFDKGADDVIARIERRVAAATMLPAENQEGLQILKYVDGQKYEPHFDYFFDEKNQAAAEGGQRVATALMYLATPEEGGETVFPDADPAAAAAAAAAVGGPGALSECARAGLAHKPRKGDMLLFYSLHPDGAPDESSLHASCPTLKGEKWSATKWIHVSGFRVGADVQKAKWAGCADTNEYCAAWAAAGECEKNPGFMLVSCRLACKACTPGNGAAGAGEAAPAA